MSVKDPAPPGTQQGDSNGHHAGGKSLLRRISAAELRRQAEAGELPQMERLSFLGTTESSPFIRGWCHLLSGYPKTGKTELLARQVMEWGCQGLRSLFITEEPELLWGARLTQLPPGGMENVSLASGLGAGPQTIGATIQAADEDVVVLDTLRLLNIEDENDAAVINAALTPLIVVARQRRQTLIIAHHTRKGGGSDGEAAAGSHALLGLVDVALELVRDPQVPARRRIMRGWGRVAVVQSLLYELDGQGKMVLLGQADSVKLAQVMVRVLEVLTTEWQPTQDVASALGNPQPSGEQVRQALMSLAAEGKVERDPSMAGPTVRGGAHKWKVSSNP